MPRSYTAAVALLLFLGTAVPPAVAVNTAHITVNVGKPLRTMDARFFGLNTAIWDYYSTTLGYAPVVSLLQATEVGSMRYPGGSTSDVFHWQTNAIEGNLGTTTIPDPSNIFSLSATGTTFDDFASLAMSLGSQPFITANYGSGTPDEAAAWVEYSNVSPHQYGFRYWEIGNECYGGWETDGNLPAHDPVEYATRFAQYYVAMKAVDPTLKLGMPASPGEDDYANYGDPPVLNARTQATHYGWLPEVLTTLRSLGVTPDFLVFHYYPIYTLALENDANLLQAPSAGVSTGSMFPVATYAAELRQQLSDYLPETGSAVELDCTECNNEAGPPVGRQSTSLVDGLFMADTMGSFLQTEFQAVVWWDSFNGQSDASGGGNFSSSVYGWRTVGDEGILYAGGGTYPTYYIFKLLGLFAHGGDTVLAASSDSAVVTPYAVEHPDGSLSILVINKDPANTWNAGLSVENAPPLLNSIAPFDVAPPIVVHSYGIPQDNAANPASPTYGIASMDLAQSTVPVESPSSGFSMEFGPYSATVITTSALPPIITTQPMGQTIGTGSTLILTAAGQYATSYQWFLNGHLVSDSAPGSTTDIVSDADGPQLVVSKITGPSAGSYTAVAVNSSGSSPASPAAVVSVVTASNPGSAGSISARAFVGTKDNILIGGFFIAGTTSRSVLIQALGPALIPPPYNVASPLAKPTLSIHQARNGQDVVLYTNTGWGSNPVLLASAARLTALPVLQPGSADSELLLTLPPGGYTAEVASADGVSTGVALCAIYQLP
jgi:hypothetical protein